MPGRSKLSLQKRDKLQLPPKTSPADTSGEGATPHTTHPRSRDDGRGPSNHQSTCPLEYASSSLISEAGIEEVDTSVPTGGLDVASWMETPSSSALTVAGSSKTASFECILCGRKCESSQNKLIHVRQCAKSMGISTAELAVLTQEDGCLPNGEEEEEGDFSVGQRKKRVTDVSAEKEGKPAVTTRRKRKAVKKEKLMSVEEEELQLAIALSASEAPPEPLDNKGWPLGVKRRRGQKQMQVPPPLASLSTSQVKRKIEHRIEQVLENKPLVSGGACVQSTPELPQSKLAGRGARVKGKGGKRGRRIPLLSGGEEEREEPVLPCETGGESIDSEREGIGGEATEQHRCDPEVVVGSEGEDSPLPMDTDSPTHLAAGGGGGPTDLHPPTPDKHQLWRLSSYLEMEDTGRFYVQCLSEHILPVVHEGEGEGESRPSLAEVEGLERAWQAERAYAGSVDGGGAELCGRGLGRKDAGVQTDEGQDRCSGEAASGGSVLKMSLDFGRLLGDTLFSDTEVKLSDGDSICAHAVVLAARWPQFREAAVQLLGSSRSHRYTLALPECDPHFVRVFLHYIYSGEVQGEGDLGPTDPTDLVAEIESFLTTTTQLSLQPLTLMEGESPGEPLREGDTNTGLAAVDRGRAPEVGGATEVGGVSEGGGALVPLEVRTPNPNGDNWPSETSEENLLCREAPPSDTGHIDDQPSTSLPVEPHDDMSSLSLDVDIPVSTFFLEHTAPLEEKSCVGTSPSPASPSNTAVGVVQQGELAGGHFEPADTVVSGENVPVSEATCCAPLSTGSCNQSVVCEPQLGPLSDSAAAEGTYHMQSLNCDFAEESFLQSNVDVTDCSDREGDSDSTESVVDSDSDGDACSSYVDLFSGVEEVGGLLQCPEMERLVTPLLDRAALLQSGLMATPSVAMATLSPTPTHSLRQTALEAAHSESSPFPSDQRWPSCQSPWSGDSPQVCSDTPPPTQSFHEPVSNCSILLSAGKPYPMPIEEGSIGKGSFQPPLPPATPAPHTLRGAFSTPREAFPTPRGTSPTTRGAFPTPAPTDAGSSRFITGPITPMPDYISMATPWLKGQLKKYGVRPLTKKRMIAKLIEIYEYLHPVVDEDGNVDVQPAATEVDEKGKAQGKGKGRSGVPCACQQSSERESDNAEERVCQYIQDNKDLYLDMVTYKPLHFTELHQRLKAAGINISKPTLMDYLDKQCITFTLPRSGRTTRS